VGVVVQPRLCTRSSTRRIKPRPLASCEMSPLWHLELGVCTPAHPGSSPGCTAALGGRGRRTGCRAGTATRAGPRRCGAGGRTAAPRGARAPLPALRRTLGNTGISWGLTSLKSRPKAARLDIDVSAGWAGPSFRGLRGGDALLVSTDAGNRNPLSRNPLSALCGWVWKAIRATSASALSLHAGAPRSGPPPLPRGLCAAGRWPSPCWSLKGVARVLKVCELIKPERLRGFTRLFAAALQSTCRVRDWPPDALLRW
jgi:hypothetical protein